MRADHNVQRQKLRAHRCKLVCIHCTTEIATLRRLTHPPLRGGHLFHASLQRRRLHIQIALLSPYNAFIPEMTVVIPEKSVIAFLAERKGTRFDLAS